MNFKVLRDEPSKEKRVQFEIDLSYGAAHLETPERLAYNDIILLRKWIDIISGTIPQPNEKKDSGNNNRNET